MDFDERCRCIEPDNKKLSVRSQCRLMEISRSQYYAYLTPKQMPSKDLALMAEIDKLYTERPCLGSRQMRRALIARGFTISRKKVQRCMRLMCICSILPKPGATIRNKEHETYPYLLRGLEITRPDQVWATDITYLPIEGGFMYLTAVIDLFSRKILSYELSNSLDSSFCVTAVSNALMHAHPEIMNTDQGCQYTGMEFTGLLKKRGVRISMDSKGRALDNIFIERFWRTLKYEFLYCNEFTSAGNLAKRLSEYIRYYNNERYHSSVEDTPAAAYARAKAKCIAA